VSYLLVNNEQNDRLAILNWQEGLFVPRVSDELDFIGYGDRFCTAKVLSVQASYDRSGDLKYFTLIVQENKPK
jgi:hypothetical protein